MNDRSIYEVGPVSKGGKREKTLKLCWNVLIAIEVTKVDAVVPKFIKPNILKYSKLNLL